MRLHSYLRWHEGEDGWVRVLFDAAVAMAHECVGRRDFTDPPMPAQEWIDGMGFADADPADVLASIAIPAPIRVGIYVYVRTALAITRREPGMVTNDVGGISQSYDLWSARNLGDLPLAAARGYWRQYLLDGTKAGGEVKL